MLLHAGLSRLAQPDAVRAIERGRTGGHRAEHTQHDSRISSVFVARPVPPHGVTKRTESPTPSRAQSPVVIHSCSLYARTDADSNESKVDELLREAARLLLDGYLVRTIQIVYASLVAMH